MTEWFYPGNAERVKYAWHAGLFVLAAGATAYNLVAWAMRGDRHLARNAAIYATLSALELAQMETHRERLG